MSQKVSEDCPKPQSLTIVYATATDNLSSGMILGVCDLEDTAYDLALKYAQAEGRELKAENPDGIVKMTKINKKPGTHGYMGRQYQIKVNDQIVENIYVQTMGRDLMM